MAVEGADVSGVDLDLNRVIADCRSARRRYLERPLQREGDGAAQLTDAEEVLTIFRDVWKALSKIGVEAPYNINHPLYVPPIYDTPMLTALLRNLVVEIRAREAFARKFETGHFIIGGVEGTGKTTLVKALAAAVAVCSSRYFIVYVDYKRQLDVRHASLVDMIAEFAIRYREQDFSGSFGALRSHHSETSSAAAMLRRLDEFLATNVVTFSQLLETLAAGHIARPGTRVGFVADEIQDVIIENSNAKDSSVHLMRSLEDFARNHVGALLVLTGSSSNLRSRLFAKDRAIEFCHYPDFNKSLCTYHHVSALRDASE
ncbi:MAG: hypothetical protein EOO38_18565, partial [Cytophagaceae bacterium]